MGGEDSDSRRVKTTGAEDSRRCPSTLDKRSPDLYKETRAILEAYLKVKSSVHTLLEVDVGARVEVRKWLLPGYLFTSGRRWHGPSAFRGS